MQNFDAEREDLLRLLKRDAYKEGDFTLSSGRQSKHYVNCKPVTLSGEGLALTSLLLLECIEPDTAAVGGLTLGADPLVSGVAIAAHFNDWQLDAIIVRKEAKGYGTNAYIEGKLPPEGSKIVVLEDVITTGGSAIKAANRLRDAGYKVDRILAIVDRQVDGEADALMEENNLELTSIFDLNEIVYYNDCIEPFIPGFHD
jgi:orotate phosphoribosyltransferase|tara:strand:- start:98 stop:697 length:600 start_codon:yes stop_codon:yes gene_type:complete